MNEKEAEEEGVENTLTLLPGSAVVTSLRMDKSLLDDLHSVAAEIKEMSGLNVTRTKLMVLACQALVDSRKAIRKQRIKNNATLREECLSAMCHTSKSKSK